MERSTLGDITVAIVAGLLFIANLAIVVAFNKVSPGDFNVCVHACFHF
jgi:hypothetical protein